MNAFSRPTEPVGDTSTATPWSSFQTFSGLMPAVPLLPRTPDPEPLAFAQVAPGHIHEERHAILTDDESASGLLHRPVLRLSGRDWR